METGNSGDRILVYFSSELWGTAYLLRFNFRLIGILAPELAVRSPGSKWIDMYLFSISPNLAEVDRNQLALIILLEKRDLDVNRLKLLHPEKPGGWYHRATLSIPRTGSLQRYSA